MPVQLRKVMANGGIDYLLKTVANDHPTGAMDYYTHPGNKPGVWLGRGCEQMGVTAGETASKEQVTRLYSQLRDPNTGKMLDNQSQSRNVSSNSVSGFDLTFTMPKSVSVLWAVGDDETRRQIMECFYESIDQTMEWWQDNIAMTRVGRGGIAQIKVKGITAARFDHWDTREHDPHLHSHVVVSNIVQRADGGWAALDGSVVYRGHIECSERQQNLLLDLLHERMGIDFEEREDPSKGTKAVVMDAVGVPADLIDRFSTRSMQTDRILSELIAERREENGNAELSYREYAELREQAFQQARKAKDEYVPSLNELISKWTSQVQELGYDPKQIVADTVGHEPESFNGVALAECAELQDKLEWLLKGDLIDYANGKDIRQDLSQYADRFIEEASQETRKAVKSNATTISRFQIEAAAERLTRRVRCDPDTRQAFTDAVVDRVVSGLVPLTPHRYQLDGRMRNDPRIDDGKGYAVMDNSRNDLYATPELIKAEHYLFDMMDRKQENWSPDRGQVRGLVDQYSRNMEAEEGHGMAGDQSEAAVELLAGNDMIMALTGPAGTGKTTTMRAVKQTYDQLAGQGRVIGMATSAKAAGGLGESLQIPTSTVAKIINDNLGGGKERRDRNIGRLEGMAEHDGGLSPSDKRRLAELYADRASNEIPQDGIVILDEASMTSTRDLETIARLCEARNARLIMTGDPYQLDAPGEGGGFLGYMERHDRVLKLTSVWRFLKRTVDGNGETRTEVNHAEVEAGLALRTGMTDPDAHGGMPGARRMLGTRLYEQLPDQDGNLVVNRNEAGRIHGGAEGSMEDKVFNLTLDALTEGRNSLLIVATNNDLSSINERITTSLQARGKVDADPNRRTALRGRLTAGKGDVVCTRKVDRTNKDQKGEFVRNGDLWTVEEVGEDGRMLLSRRDDPDATVTVSAQYARESCELGYAVTAHRSQGMTVDYGNLWVPEGGSVSSELLYVALTRGRYCNDVWIDTPDMQTLKDSYVYNHWRDVNRAEFERTHTAYGEADLEPTPLQLAEDKFNTMAANSQAPLTASETREHHAAETKGVKRLVNERDLLSDMIMEPRLYHQIEHAYGEETANLMRHDGRWERLLNTYTRAMAVDSTQVGEIISTHAEAMNGMRRSDGKLFELPDAATLAKELNDSLHERIVAPARGRDLGWRHGLVPIPQDDVNEGDGNVRRLLEQNGTMLDEAFDRKDGERLGQLTGPNAPKWMERMPAQPSPDDPEGLEGWRRLVLDVDAYRSGMGVTANYPLGPVPRKDEAGMAWRRNLSKRIGEAMGAALPGARAFRQRGSGSRGARDLGSQTAERHSGHQARERQGRGHGGQGEPHRPGPLAEHGRGNMGGIVCEGTWAGRLEGGLGAGFRTGVRSPVVFGEAQRRPVLPAQTGGTRRHGPARPVRRQVPRPDDAAHPGWAWTDHRVHGTARSRLGGRHVAGMADHSLDGRVFGIPGVVRRREGEQDASPWHGAERMVRGSPGCGGRGAGGHAVGSRRRPGGCHRPVGSMRRRPFHAAVRDGPPRAGREARASDILLRRGRAGQEHDGGGVGDAAARREDDRVRPHPSGRGRESGGDGRTGKVRGTGRMSADAAAVARMPHRLVGGRGGFLDQGRPGRVPAAGRAGRRRPAARRNEGACRPVCGRHAREEGR